MGIAAAGLALGTSDGESYLIKPGKRKAPGSNPTIRSPMTPDPSFLSRPVTSYPSSRPPPRPEPAERRMSTSILRRKTVRAMTPSSSTASNGAQSRESSVTRHGVLPFWSSDRDSSSERKETRPTSWLRRISSISRGSHGRPASSSSKVDEPIRTSTPPIDEIHQPNKLVKRSTSRRLMSSDRDTPALLRRPATSHQRSATFSGAPYTRPLTTESVLVAEQQRYITQSSTWRPFFESNIPRKRFSSGGPREPSPRTISCTPQRPATLLMAAAVEPQVTIDHESDRPSASPEQLFVPPIRRHKIRRNLGPSRRALPQRHFTDPIVRVNKDAAYGNIVSPQGPSQLSPLSNISDFEVEMPRGTPIFTSSPQMHSLSQHKFTFSNSVSAAPSDPTTASSDNDFRVFTDDDSMDMQSDSAYDTLATRATASSHSGFRQPKIETIFSEVPASPRPDHMPGLESLMERATLGDHEMKLDGAHEVTSGVGMGIIGLADQNQSGSSEEMLTPVRGPRVGFESTITTPVPRRKHHHDAILNSSPPSMGRLSRNEIEEPELPCLMDVDNEAVHDDADIDWSPEIDKESRDKQSAAASNGFALRFDHMSEDDFDEPRSTKRSSIFDWSEHQKFASEQSNGVSPRPKTVHGKQSNKAGRSRASGRKSNAALHLRSQSVPTNRDSLTETDVPSSATKFGTWALGTKPVSEEWSDDFEFDDLEDVEEPRDQVPDDKAWKRESIRSVKVPQSIIDRQQSVHVQFGQVRDFMLLVEELKRLRVQGTYLGLIDGNSRQLWEDAASIIDLATVNEEEDTNLRPPSPVSSEFFGDETPPQHNPTEDDHGRNWDLGSTRTVNRRSISSPATPPYGRSRGESLQTKTFLQTIHSHRSGAEPPAVSSPAQGRDKLPFDTQDLRDLVVRAGVITRALKEIVRKAEGVSTSPERLSISKFSQDPAFRQIFVPPDASSSPTSKKPNLPKSQSANSYFDGAGTGNNSGHDAMPSLNLSNAVEAN
ncbi:hypothetical protein B0A52_02816 [Exophiala mesophila]|uniref:Uncharacterized protein n=1 Tax=Exophiala mesophila TaxID=212818 RepID=A0A438NE07_EXOME|nr:hypothetical protein B0A52_02816 [Exophiala mesophila]